MVSNSWCSTCAQSTGDAVVPAFRDFVSGEKQRLAQKKQAVFKAERDKWTADFVKFSQTFKVSPSSTLLTRFWVDRTFDRSSKSPSQTISFPY